MDKTRDEIILEKLNNIESQQVTILEQQEEIIESLKNLSLPGRDYELDY